MLTLKTEIRDPKIRSKYIRREEKIPAVFYGRKEKSTPVVISQKEFEKIWKEAGESTVITLSHQDKKINALIHDVQVDPVKGHTLHVDFYVVEADKEVEVAVPIEYAGVSPAVKELGGTLVKVLHEIEVSGLPKDLPQLIEVDISSLTTLESQIVVRDLVLPQGIIARAEPDEIVAAISVAKEEEIAEEEFDSSQVEVEKKGKQEEEEAESTDGKNEEKKK